MTQKEHTNLVYTSIISKKEDKLNLVTRTPVFGVYDYGILKLACVAVEAR